MAWLPIPGADHYEVQLSWVSESPTPTRTYFDVLKSTEPRLKLSSLQEMNRGPIRQNFTAGRTGSWRVNAFDAEGKRIGTSLEERVFFVAKEFEAP